ncbi:MAG: DUF2079 domain-containing protein [Oscillospiraceae bacterium]|nr:DUF2079 domain-containing protein [Oscillospiraceae bacterium]
MPEARHNDTFGGSVMVIRNLFCEKTRQARLLFAGGGWLALLFAGGFAGSFAVLLRAWRQDLPFTDLRFVVEMPWGMFFGVFFFAWLGLTALCLYWASARPLQWALAGVYLAFAFVLCVTAEASVYFSLGLCVPLFLIVRWAFREHFSLPRVHEKLRRRGGFAVTVLLFFGMATVLAYASILRYRVYQGTTFDLGVFGQMFASLARGDGMTTTLERNAPLSHFAVHCSPFYYVLLPFYALVPRVEVLLVLQALGVASGVFAVRAIARQCFGAHFWGELAVVLLYFLHPAFGYGCVYDFHENKFLAPLLLWTFYFLLRGKWVLLAVFALLTLSVKEDAAVYIAALGLFALFRGKKQRLAGAVLLGGAILWFFAAVGVVAHFGGGVMVSRLRNYYLPGEGGHGFGDIVRVLLFDFGYAIREMFTAEKVAFLLYLFLPLAFVPLLSRKNHCWILLLPVAVMHLLSNYSYQHQMGFQYVYGSAALAVALAVLVFARMRTTLRRQLMGLALGASLLCTAPLFAERLESYRDIWAAERAAIAATDTALAALPPNAEITATTWFPPHLTGRAAGLYLYPNYYGQQRVTEYLLCRPEEAVSEEGLAAFLEQHYVFLREEGYIQIYRAAWVYAEQSAPAK